MGKPTEQKALTIDDFCRWFANKEQEFNYRQMDIKVLAEDFKNMFRLKYPLSADQLVKICLDSGYDVQTFSKDQKSRGYNFTLGKKVVICVKEDDSPPGHIHSLLHELFEMIDKGLWPFSDGAFKKPKNYLEIDADRFAAYVHLPHSHVREWLEANGFDVFGLRELMNCSYATAIIRFNEVLCTLVRKSTNAPVPVINILYQRPYWKNQSSNRTPRLQLNCYQKSRGFKFLLKRSELSEIAFSSPKTDTLTIPRLISIFSHSKSNVLLMNFEMNFRDNCLDVDVLIRTVNWRQYRGAAKVLIQIMPCEYPDLRDLADQLDFPKEDMTER